jgi:prevent-host-death family protein
MMTITAKDLKNRTGAALRLIKAGERILITVRGKPQALLIPVEENIAEPAMREMQDAWRDIEKTLQSSEPQFPTWKEAVQRSGRKAWFS